MTISPVIERELRVALRKKNSRKSRFKYAAIGVGLAALCLIVHALFGFGTFATRLHGWLFYLGLYVAVFQTLQLTADLFTQERQNNTFGLLFLAGLSPGELFGGKVLSAFVVSSSNLMALAPCFAIPFLTGGVSLSLFLATLFCLPTMLVFTLATVCLASALWEEESTARIGAVWGGSLLCAAPLMFYELSTWTAHPVSTSWRLLSPAWGPWMVDRQFSSGGPAEFWVNCAVTLAWACLFFIVASVALRRSWNRELSGTTTPTWAGKMFAWMRGRSDWRRKQARWLDVNPCAWLAMSNRQPVRLAWAMMAMVVALSALGCWLMPRAWFAAWNVFAFAFVNNGSVEWIRAHTAAKRLADERRSSGLELLLTTPLEVRDLIDGHMIALDLQFRPFFQTAFFLNLAAMLGGLFIRTWNWRSVCDYLMIGSFFLLWSYRGGWPRTFKNSIKPMWAGFNTGLPGLAVSRSMGVQRFWWVYNVYIFQSMLMGHKGFPSGSWTEFWFIMVLGVTLLASFLFKRLGLFKKTEEPIEKMLLSEFRLIAAEPLPDPKDPRLKRWKVGERLYHHYANTDPVLKKLISQYSRDSLLRR